MVSPRYRMRLGVVGLLLTRSRTANHEPSSWAVLSGFRVTRLEDPFIVAGDGTNTDWWLLVTERR